MSNIIRLTPVELRHKAFNIENSANVANAEIKQVEQIVSSLRSTFLGETASAFFKEFDASLRDIEQWDNIIRSFSAEIRDAANKLERADKAD
jgi:WXG100 family type VII secretion target